MKELSIEEKAQRYDEALEKAKEYYKDCKQRGNLWFVEDMEDMFPELKESEDEKIRKGIIQTLEFACAHKLVGVDDVLKMKAYLEKQGEQKDILEDAVFDNNEDGLIADTIKAKNEQKPMKTCAEYYNEKSEYKMPELTDFQNLLADILMQREYEGNTETEADIARARLDYELAAIRISEKLLPLAIEHKPAEWSEEDESMLNFVKVVLNKHKNDESFDKFKTTLNDCFTWFRNIKSRVGCEVNCTTTKEWSEEDEKHIHSIISTIECCKAQFKEAIAVIEQYDSDLDWFKSLKDRYTWKPSDEQMNALYTYIYNPQYFNSPDPRMELVESVYKDLKKLREE